MGFLDKAIKKGIGDAIGGAIGNKVVQAVEQATGVDFDKNGQAGSTGSAYGTAAQPAAVSGQQETYQASSASIYTTPATEKPYFRTIIQECFGNYVIREDVPVSEFGGQGRPYDFALFSGGECCAVVMLVAHNRDNNRAYKGAKAAAGANGVPFINFYTHMPNERGFVINRIKRLAKP